MTFAVGPLVHETSTSTGTGNFTLSNVDGRNNFNAEYGTGGTDVIPYYISHRAAGEWEEGTGHLSASTTLVRDTVIRSSNSDSAVNFSAGTKDVTSDVLSRDVPLHRGFISGLVPTQGTDANHDTDISVGECRDDTNTENIRLSSTLTIQIDAAAGINSIDTGSVAADTWYYIWLLKGSSGIGAVYSTSKTTPTEPSGYQDAKRLIGAVLTDGSSNITDYTCCELSGGGLLYYWDNGVQDLNTGTGSTSEQTVTLTAPPIAGLEAIVSAEVQRSGSTGRGKVYPTDVADPVGWQVSGNAPGGTTSVANTTFRVKVDSSGQVHWRIHNSNNELDIFTIGWAHHRGVV